MPNHITTQLAIYGSEEKIKKLIEDTGIKLEADLPEGNKFDFNGIVKEPEGLAETTSPTKIVATQEEADTINNERAERHKQNNWPGSPEVEALSEAEAQRRRTEYGALNWYDWRNANWGTKWNSYDVHYTDHKFNGDKSKLVVQFDTAWDTPREIITALEEQGFEVNGVYYGEMDGFGEIGNMYNDFEAYQTVEVEYIS